MCIERLTLPAVLMTAAALSLGLSADPARGAEPVNLSQCGVIRSVQPSTSTTAGSIVIGSRTFQIDIAVRLDSTPIGQARCVSGPMLQSTIFIAPVLSPVPESICGLVRSLYTPAAGPGGLSIGSDPELVLKIPIGANVPDIQNTTQCVSISIDVAGDAVYAGLRQLPNTSTETGSTNVGWLLSTLTALAGFLVWARAIRRRPA